MAILPPKFKRLKDRTNRLYKQGFRFNLEEPEYWNLMKISDENFEKVFNKSSDTQDYENILKLLVDWEKEFNICSFSRTGAETLQIILDEHRKLTRRD